MDLEKKLSTKNEPNWFVLNDDGYQGHFSKSDVEYLFNAKQIGLKNLIWNESLDSWREIQSVKEFSNLDFSIIRPAYVKNIEPKVLSAIQAQPNRSAKIKYKLDRFDLAENPSAKNKKDQFKSIKKTPVILTALTAIIAITVTSFIVNSGYKNIDILTVEENNFLKSTALSAYTPGNEKSEIVITPSKLKSEISVFVATNQPQVESVEVLFESIPNSLISNVKVRESKKIPIKNLVAQAKFNFFDTEKIIPGMYKISALFNDKIIAQKKVLLGDLSEKEYLTEIQKYRLQLNVQIENEIAELKQVILLVENQKNQIKKGLKGESLKNWRELQIQIVTIAQHWNTSDKSPQHFSDLYKSMQQLIEEVSRLEKNSDAESIEKIQTSLDSLKSNISYYESLIPN